MHAEREKARRNPHILETLERLAKKGSWKSLVEAGDVYKKGDYPLFRPDASMAMELFQTACMCPDGNVSGVAQSKIVELREAPILPVDAMGRALPTVYGKRLIRAAKETFLQTSEAFGAFGQPVARAHKAETKTPERPRPPIPRPVVYSDKQNVHDHGVMHSLGQTLEAIKKNVEACDNSCVEVEAAVLDNEKMSDEDKAKALHVIESIVTSKNMKHSGVGLSESDALDLVWAHIQKLDAPKNKNATETLLQQLASGVENGFVVCSTGKMGRIVGSLDGLDGVTPIRPMWAVRAELGTLAATLRGDGEYSVKKLKELKDDFTRQATQTYCTDLGLDEKIMAPLIEMYAEAF